MLADDLSQFLRQIPDFLGDLNETINTIPETSPSNLDVVAHTIIGLFMDFSNNLTKTQEWKGVVPLKDQKLVDSIEKQLRDAFINSIQPAIKNFTADKIGRFPRAVPFRKNLLEYISVFQQDLYDFGSRFKAWLPPAWPKIDKVNNDTRDVIEELKKRLL